MSFFRIGLLVAAFGMGLSCVLTAAPAQAHDGAAIQQADGDGGAPTHAAPAPQYT